MELRRVHPLGPPEGRAGRPPPPRNQRGSGSDTEELFDDNGKGIILRGKQDERGKPFRNNQTAAGSIQENMSNIKIDAIGQLLIQV